MDDDLLAQLAERYELQRPRAELLGAAWNTTYRITDSGGARYSLRLSHPNVQDPQLIEAELAFVAFVAARGQVRVPHPVPSRGHGYVAPVATPEGARWCVLSRWVEGEEARGRLTPPLARQVGRAAAHLHEAARAFPFPAAGDGFREGYCYDEELVRSHADWIATRAEQIGPERVALLREAVRAVLEVLAACEKRRDTYGVIHADLLPRNILVDGGQVAVIDFDQVGRGYFCYDIAVFMVGLEAEPVPFAEHWASFLAGYREVAPLPYEGAATLEACALAVDLVFLDAFYNSWTPEGRAQYGPQLPAVYESVRGRLQALRSGERGA